MGTTEHFYKIAETRNKNIIYFDQWLLSYDLDLTKYKAAKIYSEKLIEISKINTRIMIPCYYLKTNSKNLDFINIKFLKIKEFNFAGATFCILESSIK